ncbi:Hsp70 family protein [Amycolatopsis lurida]
MPPGQAVAVFDMGGGTTDVAVLRRTGTGWDVLAEAGLPDFGGRDLDQLLLDHLGVEVDPSADAAGRRAARVLAEDVRAGKEALSQYSQTDIPLPAPRPDAHLTRQELETLVEPALRRAVDLLAETVGTTSLTAVHLVGGATRMPLVARLISERLGLVPTIVDSPETSVALGALGPGQSPQWTPQTPQTPLPPPPLPRSTPMPPPEKKKPPVAAITTAIVVTLLAAGGVTAAALLRPDTVGTAVAGPTPSAPPGNPAFRGDEQLIAFAGTAAGKADECVNVMGTASQGDQYSARNHVRCRFEVDGIAYFANYLSADGPQTCSQLNEEFLELPGAQWLSEETWTGGDLRGKSHDVAATSGNNVLWYTDTNTLCAFFGASTDQNPPMPEVHQAWKTVVGA